MRRLAALAVVAALACGCASDGPAEAEAARDGRPIGLDFSPEQDADAAIQGVVDDLRARDRQGWPETVTRSAPPRSRPLLSILAVRNMTSRSWDTMVVRRKLEQALLDAGVVEVITADERRASAPEPGGPLGMKVDVAEERRTLEGGATTVEYTVTIQVVDQGSGRPVALVKDSVTKRRG